MEANSCNSWNSFCNLLISGPLHDVAYVMDCARSLRKCVREAESCSTRLSSDPASYPVSWPEVVTGGPKSVSLLLQGTRGSTSVTLLVDLWGDCVDRSSGASRF